VRAIVRTGNAKETGFVLQNMNLELVRSCEPGMESASEYAPFLYTRRQTEK
jgi:hypothetical protein